MDTSDLSEGALLVRFVTTLRDLVKKAKNCRDVELTVVLLRVTASFTSVYIDTVHIMHPDPKIRSAQLAFLDFINTEIFHQIADFSKIQKISKTYKNYETHTNTKMAP